MTMTGKDRAEAAAALLAWFQSQDISVPGAGEVLVMTLGIIIGEAAKTDEGLIDGLEALVHSVTRYAKITFNNKQTNRT